MPDVSIELSLSLPEARSCQELKDMGVSTDGEYMVDPDRLGIGEAPVLVSCNMTGRDGQTATSVAHDSEARTHVNMYEYPQFYLKTVHYNIPRPQLAALLALSNQCEQFIRYDCKGSVLNSAIGRGREGGIWESRGGQNMTYWGGASPGSGKCACGMTLSCVDPSKVCNCDANLNTWQYDEGYLTDKSTLPVMKMYFGDTGAASEEGYHTLGKLVCYGLQN